MKKTALINQDKIWIIGMYFRGGTYFDFLATIISHEERDKVVEEMKRIPGYFYCKVVYGHTGIKIKSPKIYYILQIRKDDFNIADVSFTWKDKQRGIYKHHPFSGSGVREDIDNDYLIEAPLRRIKGGWLHYASRFDNVSGHQENTINTLEYDSRKDGSHTRLTAFGNS